MGRARSDRGSAVRSTTAGAGPTLLHHLGHAPLPRAPAPSADVVDLAIEHRVAAPLLQASTALDAIDRDRLRSSCRASARSHLAAMRALGELLPALSGADVPHLVVKGPVLQAAWGSVTRPYLDLDVLVPPGALGVALDVLAGIGATTVDRNWALLTRERRAELHLELADGFPLDLHWHLVNHGEHRDRLAIAVDDLLAGSRVVEVGGLAIPTMGRAETLVHTCLHAAVSGGHHLVWLLDIARLLDQEGPASPPPVEEVVAIATRWRAGLPVAAMLARAARTVGAVLDPDLLEALAPAVPQRALVRALSTWRSGGRLPGGGSTDRAVARSLRPTLPGTARATAREGRSMLARLVDHHEFWADPDDPRHVCFDSGADGFEGYLAMASTGR